MNKLIKKGKPILWLVIVAFLANTLFAQNPVQADNVPFLPIPGQMVALTPAYSLPLIRGVKVFKDNPFKFEFVMSQGDNTSISKAVLKDEADKLVKYFLASLTTPEKDMWVNLSPYERNRIVPSSFGVTQMGKELLAQDYLLKQVTASVMYPEGKVGREFWKKVYEEAYQRFGTTNIPVNTFNKVWIVPDQAEVYENAATSTAVIIKSSLKVMLEEDYLALKKHNGQPGNPLNVKAPQGNPRSTNELGSQVIREIVIPALTKEVNSGANFASLRQVYNSLILAYWYKNKLKQSLISKGYVDRNKTGGVDVNDRQVDQKIYSQYLTAYKKGVYNYIKEEVDPTGQTTPRKYFSGGVFFGKMDGALLAVTGPDAAMSAVGVLKAVKKFVIYVTLAASLGLVAQSGALANTLAPVADQTANKITDIANPGDGIIKIATRDFEQVLKMSHNDSVNLANQLWAQHSFDIVQQNGQILHHPLSGMLHPGEKVILDLGSMKEKPVIPAAAAPAHIEAGTVDALATIHPDLTANKTVTALPNEEPNFGGKLIIAAGQSVYGGIQGFGNFIQKSFQSPFTVPFHFVTTEEKVVEPPMLLTGGAYALLKPEVVPSLVDSYTRHEGMVPHVYRDPNGKQDLIFYGFEVNNLLKKGYITPDIATGKVTLDRQQAYQMGNQILVKILPDYIYKAVALFGGAEEFRKLRWQDQVVAIEAAAQTSGKAYASLETEGWVDAVKSGDHKLAAQIISNSKIFYLTRSRALAYGAVLTEGKPAAHSSALAAIGRATIRIKKVTTVVWDYQSVERLGSVLKADAVGIAPYTLGANFTALSSGNLVLSYNSPKFMIPMVLPVAEARASVSFPRSAVVAAVEPPRPVVVAAESSNVVGDLEKQLAAIKAIQTKDAKAIIANKLEEAKVREQIRQARISAARQKTPAEIRDENAHLVKEFDLTVPPAHSVVMRDPLPRRPPLTVFYTPNVVRIAFLDDEIRRAQKSADEVIKTQSPITGQVALNYNAYDFTIARLGHGATTFNIVPSYPFQNIDTLYRIGQGFSNFGAQNTFSQVTGPLFFADGVAQLVDYVKMHESRGQDVQYDTRIKDPISQVIQTVTVHVIPAISYDRDGHIVEQNLYRMGLVETFQAVLGKLDAVLGDTGFLGNSDNYFIEDSGKHIKYGDLHKAYTLAAALNTDQNTMFIHVYQSNDPHQRFRKNDKTGWDEIPASTPVDPYLDFYSVTDNGFIIHLDPATGKMTGQRVYTSPAFVTQAYARKLAEEQQGKRILGMPYLALHATFIQRDRSIPDLKIERMVESGKDDQGRIIWGVLRQPITGHILKIITDPMDLARMDRLKDSLGHTFSFVPGNPNLGAQAGNVFTDYIADQFKGTFERYRGVVHGETVREEYQGADLSGRPLADEPAAIKALRQSRAAIFNPNVPLTAIYDKAKSHWGVVFFVDGRFPTVLTSLDNLRVLKSLDESNGVKKLPNGMYLLGAHKAMPGDALVFIDAKGKAVGFIDPSENLRLKRVHDLEVERKLTIAHEAGFRNYGVAYDANNVLRPLMTQAEFNAFINAKYVGVTGQTFVVKGKKEPVVITDDMMVRVKTETVDGVEKRIVVEIMESGERALRDHRVVLSTLTDAQGHSLGVEAEDQRAIDPRTNLPVVTIFAKGNDLTDDQKRLGIQPEAELVRLLSIGQAKYVPVPGSDKRRLLILHDAPRPVITLPEHSQLELKSMEVASTDERVAFAVASTALASQTVSDYNEKYALVRFWSDNPAPTPAEEARKPDLPSQRILISDLENPTPELRAILAKKVVEILKINDQGDGIGRFVYVYGTGYRLWMNGELESKSKSNFLVVFKDNTSAFVSLDQLKDPVFGTKIRPLASDIMIMDKDQHVQYRLYLDPDSRYSKIEEIHADGTSTIYKWSPSFSFDHKPTAIASTTSSIDADGLKHIIMTNLEPGNAGVRIEDVYRVSADGRQTLVYSDRFLQNERIYFKDGHEYYSVSLNYSNKQDPHYQSGQTISIDGKDVEHVTGLFKFNDAANSGYHVGLRSIERKGWHAPIRLTVFENGHITQDQTGFVKLEPGLSYDQVMQRTVEKGVLNMTDRYVYGADGQVDYRSVSFFNEGHWFDGWTLKVNYIGTDQDFMIDQLIQNPDIAASFARLGVTNTTNLVEAIRTTPLGVVTKDYRIQGDVLERKIFTVISQDGQESKIIAGLGFDSESGEQTDSFEMTPDLEVKARYSTIPNEETMEHILSSNIGDWYAQYMQEFMNTSNADLWADLARGGVSRDFVPVSLKKTPYLVKTEKPVSEGYRLSEANTRALYEKYFKASKADRPAIEEEIRAAVVKFHLEQNNAHFTAEQGQSIVIYLPVSPNDGRNLVVVVKGHEGGKPRTYFEAWNLEGLGSFKPNILPGTIVYDPTTDQLTRTMAFDHNEIQQFNDPQGKSWNVHVNYYTVHHDPKLVGMAFRSLGDPVYEDKRYERIRVANGMLGVASRGIERTKYDPLLSILYPLPTHAILIDDTDPNEIGRLTMAELYSNYQGDGQESQSDIETTLRDRPTAPGNVDILTQTIRDGEELDHSKTQEDFVRVAWQDIKGYWFVPMPYLLTYPGIFLAGGIIGGRRLARIKAKLAEDVHPQVLQLGRAQDVDALLPIFANYGFSDDVLANAYEKFMGKIIPMLKTKSMDQILEEYFRDYQVWRKEYLKTDVPFTPTVDDLWVMFLIDSDNGVFNADTPSFLAYLTHEAINARHADGELADIGGYVRKEYYRFHDIIQLQTTSFQGGDAGNLKNVAPYDAYINKEDIEDMFRTTDFIRWYSSIPHSLDGKADLREAIYRDFIDTLAQKVVALKGSSARSSLNGMNFINGTIFDPNSDSTVWRNISAFDLELKSGKALNDVLSQAGYANLDDAIQDIAGDRWEELQDVVEGARSMDYGIKRLVARVGSDVFKLKRLIAGLPEYQDYIQFFRDVQKNGYRVSSYFSFPGYTDDYIDQLIDQKPLVLKTFAEAGLPVGRTPLLIRAMKPIAQYIRNNYQRVLSPMILSSFVGISVAWWDGMLSWEWALGITAAIIPVAVGINKLLNWVLDRNLNVKSFGKPKLFSNGYSRVKLTKSQIGYRTGFWSVVVPAIIGWDAFLYHFFFIPLRETYGEMWHPLIAGFEIPLNMNFLLMGAMATTGGLFIYMAKMAATYLFQPHFTYIHGAIRGVGTLKTIEDLRRFDVNDNVNRLIERTLLPLEGAGLSDEARANGRKAIIKYAFEQYRLRDRVSDAEYEEAVDTGRIDHIKNLDLQQDIVVAINGLLMDSPVMPRPEDAKPISVINPVYGEELVSSFADLDKIQKTGYSQLNYLISRVPQRWQNLMERVKREGIASPDELGRMRALMPRLKPNSWVTKIWLAIAPLFERFPRLKRFIERHLMGMQVGKLGDVNGDLKMQIRLWASYELQPYARTLDGEMNLVRSHQLLLRIAHPDWSEQEIKVKTNQDIQIVWAYQIWGNVLSQPELQAKKDETFYLLKKYYDELGFIVDIASVQKRNGMNYKVLSQYDPRTDDIVDRRIIAITDNNPITLEGKGANLAYAESFARNKFHFHLDMNQDINPLEAIKSAKVTERFNDEGVGVVNMPEKINTRGFSLTSLFHADDDETFARDVKRHRSMVAFLGVHGHPDFARDTTKKRAGGIATTEKVSEDSISGEKADLRGVKVVQAEEMEIEKSRENDFFGTNGIWRKFSMGAAQWLLSRTAFWSNNHYGVTRAAGESSTGPRFYEFQTIAALAFFEFALVVMIGGVSIFTAIPSAAVTMMVGVLWIGQAIVFLGITHKAQRRGALVAMGEFFAFLVPMVAFHVAHIFTYEVGFISGLLGLAAYVATGRLSGRENVGPVQTMDAYGSSHILIGAAGLALTAIGYYIWRNLTFMLSFFTIITFYFAAIVPMSMDHGNYPVNGVTRRISAALFSSNFGAAVKALFDIKGKDNSAKGNLLSNLKEKGLKTGLLLTVKSAGMRNTLKNMTTRAIGYGIWAGKTLPLQIPGLVENAFRGKPKLPGQVVGEEEPVEGPADAAMQTHQPMLTNRIKIPGGIDLGRTVVKVDNSSDFIKTAFDDPAMLRLLLNSDGLAPIIDDIKPMTASMVNNFVGLN